MQTEREGGTGGQVYLLRHGRSEISSLSSALSSTLAMQAEAGVAFSRFSPGHSETSWDCPVSLSSMLAMQTELGGLASYAFHTVALKSLPSVLLSPVAMQAEGGGALPHFSRGRSDHVSHAGRAGGGSRSAFSRFPHGRSEISSLSPALSRQPVAPGACHPR
jgi:hypothetical protein